MKSLGSLMAATVPYIAFLSPHRILEQCCALVRKGGLILIEGSLCAWYNVRYFTSWLITSGACFKHQECSLFPMTLGQSHVTATSRSVILKPKNSFSHLTLTASLPLFLPSVGRNFCCDGKGRRVVSFFGLSDRYHLNI